MASIPIAIIHSAAAPAATTCATGWVPASNLAGGAMYCAGRSIQASSTIEPPKFAGGRASSSSRRPYRKPTPVGPYILCALQTAKSTSKA